MAGICKLVTGSVSAGFPGVVNSYGSVDLDLNEFCVKHQASTFFVKVDGYSMINAGIFDGDILVVDRSLDPANNSVVVAFLNGGFTLKRIMKQGGRISLMPENPQYKPIHIRDSDEFEIWGVVTFVIKDMR